MFFIFIAVLFFILPLALIIRAFDPKKIYKILIVIPKIILLDIIAFILINIYTPFQFSYIYAHIICTIFIILIILLINSVCKESNDKIIRSLIIIPLIVFILIGFVPFAAETGCGIMYSSDHYYAIFYSVDYWHEYRDTELEDDYYLTTHYWGTDIYIFPFNLIYLNFYGAGSDSRVGVIRDSPF